MLASSLSFAGLDVRDAMSAETEIAAGIASSLPGVAADEVRITEYTTAADGSVVVSFEVPSALCGDAVRFLGDVTAPVYSVCELQCDVV